MTGGGNDGIFLGKNHTHFWGHALGLGNPFLKEFLYFDKKKFKKMGNKRREGLDEGTTD